MRTQQLNTIIATQRPQELFALGYQKLTVTGGTAQALTVPSGTVYAEIAVESATTTGTIIRYLNLGAATLPTTTNGMPLAHGTVFDLNNGDQVVDFRCIAVSGSHTLHIQYFRH